jgi:catechol 2,3-dioxygenase-like lactoylglutathione lyase family enzyme
MLSTARVTAFLATALPRRAAEFYGETLGLPQITEDQFALVFDLHGVELRIQKVERLRPQAFTVLGWQVPHLATVIASLTARGIVFERFSGLTQSVDGVWRAPSGAAVAWFRDPDGNLLSVAEYPLSNDR